MVARFCLVASMINVRHYYFGLRYLSTGYLHATFLLGTTSSRNRSKDSNLTSGKKYLLDGWMKMGVASGSFRSLAYTAADFMTCIEFGRVGTVV